MQHDKILILDFGSQVTQLIARRVREAHVYCEVHPCDVDDDWMRAYAADGALKGVILSGSHASTYESHQVARAGCRLVARCAGARHLLRHVHDGGAAGRPGRGEYTPRVRLRRGACEGPHGAAGRHRRLRDVGRPTGMLKVWMSHGDKITELPPGFKLMASTPSLPHRRYGR